MPATLLLALGLFSAAATNDQDACASLIPPALAARLATDLPDFSLPTTALAGAARVRALATSGDWPCPFVVAGDFDGNGWLDRALLLPGKIAGVRLVTALNQEGQWQLSLNESWPLAAEDSYLTPQEPGLYQRGDAIAQPAAQLDQLPGLQAEQPGFAAGKLNGMQSVYFFINSHWQKLALRDE